MGNALQGNYNKNTVFCKGILEQADLTGIRKISKCSRILQHLDMGLGYLWARLGYLLNGDEALALSAVHQIPRRILSQSRNGHKGRQDLPVLNQEFGGVAFVQGDR